MNRRSLLVATINFCLNGKQDKVVIFSLLPCPVFSGSKNRIETWIHGKNTLKTGHCTIIPNLLLCPVFRSLSGFSFFRDAEKYLDTYKITQVFLSGFFIDNDNSFVKDLKDLLTYDVT